LLETADQCLQFNPNTASFSAGPARHPAGSLKPLGLLKDGRVCVQTRSTGTAAQGFRLETYDGVRFERLSVPPPDVPPGSNLSTLFAAQNGDLWVSGDRGTACYHDRKWRTFASTDGSNPDSVVGFAESADGKTWCATHDKVWAFDGHNWSVARVALDHVDALITTRDGSLWVATDGGLHRFFQGSWVETARKKACPPGACANSARISVAEFGPAPPTA